MRRLVLPALLAAVAAACAPSPGGAPGIGMQHSSRDVLTGEEIRRSPEASSAYDAVRRLRPEFLRGRGVSSLRRAQPDRVVVYVNGVPAGGPEALQQIPASDVKEIRYISAADATTRYGTGHAGGALEVTTG